MNRLAVLVLAAAVGYLVARHSGEIRASLDRFRRQGAGTPPGRRWDDVTEFEHEYEREAAHRHEVAEEIRRRPLRERQQSSEDSDTIASQPIRRERDDHPYPTSY